MTLKTILTELGHNPKKFNEYLDKYFDNKFQYTGEISELFLIAIKAKDASLVDNLLVIAGRDGLNKRYTEILCDLLKVDWHDRYEDIISCLEKIKDPQSVNCIYQASLIIIDYDDGRSLQRKCIWALGAIGSEEAVEKLKLLAKSDNPIVREIAQMQIDAAK